MQAHVCSNGIPLRTHTHTHTYASHTKMCFMDCGFQRDTRVDLKNNGVEERERRKMNKRKYEARK